MRKTFSSAVPLNSFLLAVFELEILSGYNLNSISWAFDFKIFFKILTTSEVSYVST